MDPLVAAHVQARPENNSKVHKNGKQSDFRISIVKS